MDRPEWNVYSELLIWEWWDCQSFSFLKLFSCHKWRVNLTQSYPPSGPISAGPPSSAVGLQTWDQARGRTPSPGLGWLVQGWKVTQTTNQSPFQTKDLRQCYSGMTYCCLPRRGRPSLSEEGTSVPKRKLLCKMASGTPTASSTSATCSLNFLSFCEELSQHACTSFVLKWISVACKQKHPNSVIRILWNIFCLKEESRRF